MGKWFDNFPDALKELSDSGGAMLYDSGDWYVSDYEQVADMLSKCTVRQATNAALREGGMSYEQMMEFFKDWTD